MSHFSLASRPATVEHATRSDDPSVQAPADEESLPRWFEWLVVVVGAGVVCFGFVGLLLALAGQFRPWLAIVIGAAATVAAVFAARPISRPRGATSSSTNWSAVAMVAVALALALWNGVHDGHHVVQDIDAGGNSISAKWIAEHGDLVVHAGADWQDKGSEFAFGSQLTFTADYANPNSGDLEFQFVHFLPALMAEGSALGGDAGLFFVVPLLGSLGLIAIYAIGCRLARRPWIVLAVVTSLGLSLPQVWTSRDPYSETSTQVLLWCGLWLLAEAFHHRRLGPAALGGLAVGATFATRIDGLIYLAPLPILAAFVFLTVYRRPDRGRWLALIAVVTVTSGLAALVGGIDLEWRSTGYYRVLKGNVHSLIAAVVLSAVLAVALVVVVLAIPRLRTVWTTIQRPAAFAAGGATVLVLIGFWAIRPYFKQHTTLEHTNSVIVGRQKAEGQAVDLFRTYGEQSMRWMSWYLGPVTVTLAIIGLGLLVFRLFNKPDVLVILVLAIPGACSILYLWNPEITPLQVYVMRRYVPSTLPLLAVGAACAAAWLIDALPAIRSARKPLRAFTAATTAVLLAFPIGVLIPVRGFRVQAGFNGLIDKACRDLGANAAVLMPKSGKQPGGVTDSSAVMIGQTLRSWCGVPVASLASAIDAAQLVELATRFRQEGKVLWVVASTTAGISAVSSTATPRLLGSVTNDRQLGFTLARAPDGYIKQGLTIYAARIAG